MAPLPIWPRLGSLLFPFLISFGVVLGGSLFAGLAALLTGAYPVSTSLQWADRLKVWGTAIAMGGSLINLSALEQGLFALAPRAIMKDLVHLALAFAGALSAAWLLAACLDR